MPLKSSLVGTGLGSVPFDATQRRLLAYAAALGETTPPSFDDTAPAFAALPQFCVCGEWSLVSQPGAMARLGLTAEEARGGLHLGQDSTFHAPIPAGARLRVTGTLVEARAVRKGALTVTRLDTTDVASGRAYATTWSTGLMLGVVVEGEGRCTERRPDAPGASAPPPSAAGIITVPIARELPHVYTECSGIWNPIHTERRAALALGLPDIILHGTATWAIAGRELARAWAGGEARRFRRLAGEFRAPVIPGTQVTIEHSPVEGHPGSVRFTLHNHLGEPAVTDGIAEFTLDTPSGSER